MALVFVDEDENFPWHLHEACGVRIVLWSYSMSPLSLPSCPSPPDPLPGRPLSLLYSFTPSDTMICLRSSVEYVVSSSSSSGCWLSGSSLGLLVAVAQHYIITSMYLWEYIIINGSAPPGIVSYIRTTTLYYDGWRYLEGIISAQELLEWLTSWLADSLGRSFVCCVDG